ncbi:MAG: hypothetical protein HZA89_06840 [Verrucomicrobia bacterium]|nr:hypothetical protein [Verrucomicrobiota bacterium]
MKFRRPANEAGSSLAVWVLLVALVAAVAAVIIVNSVKEEKISALGREIRNLKAKTFLSGDDPKQTPDLDAIRKERQELARLRTEVKDLQAKLQESGQYLEKLQAENQQIRAINQQLGAQNQQLAAAPPPLPAPVAQILTVPGLPAIALLPDEDANAVSAAYIADQKNLKELGEALSKFVEANQDVLPRSLDQLKPLLPEEVALSLNFSRYEMAATGPLAALRNLAKTALIREKRKDRHGLRGYVLGDGTAQIVKESE